MKALLLIFFLSLSISGGKDKAREANKAYREGDYAKAEEGYRAALKADPQNPKLVFNLGNALARQKKYDEALQKFDTFGNMVNDPASRARALYNMGNIFADQKQWDKALSFYRKSLELNPDDGEAKYNYELAYRHQKQNKHNKNDGKNNPNKQNKNSKNNKNQNNKNSKNQQNNNQKNKSGNNNQQPPQNKNKQANKSQQKMSRQEANKILSALQDQENNLLKNLRKQQTKSDTKKNGKDW